MSYWIKSFVKYLPASFSLVLHLHRFGNANNSCSLYETNYRVTKTSERIQSLGRKYGEIMKIKLSLVVRGVARIFVLIVPLPNMDFPCSEFIFKIQI